MKPQWAKRDAARKDLEAIFRAAYEARGFSRWKMFTQLACMGAWHGLFSWWGALRLMVYGCALNRPVRL